MNFSQIARMAGVGHAVVANWRRRHGGLDATGGTEESPHLPPPGRRTVAASTTDLDRQTIEVAVIDAATDRKLRQRAAAGASGRRRVFDGPLDGAALFAFGGGPRALGITDAGAVPPRCR